MTTKTELLPLPEGNVAHLIATQVAEIERDEALLRQALEALLGQRGEPDWHTGKQRENAIAALRELEVELAKREGGQP